ncbi:MAG: hypothetical protein C0599_14790 [Salinivirgaceae bacterium]|nr:MAG: hypothetical protein C0599_14790 [Salinivirgaceae bacterium]
MKKIGLFFLGALLSFATVGQGVSDNEIIPVAVNLNSILRLNVTSGGNIEFTVNTIDQYESGIVSTSQYETSFTVASSTDFIVQVDPEDAALIPVGNTDGAASTMALGLIEYDVVYAGTTGVAGDYTLATGQELAAAATNIVEASGGTIAGDINKNAFTIQWALATAGNSNGTLISQNLPAARYATNVALLLIPQ